VGLLRASFRPPGFICAIRRGLSSSRLRPHLLQTPSPSSKSW
jgi:hypothetical protein